MRNNPLIAAGTALAIVAMACAAWFGWSWYHAAHSTSLGYAKTRDVVLSAAEQGVLNFNTLDYRNASQGLRLWLSSSTGTLHSELAQDLSQEVTLVQQRKTITSAKILDAAVTQLDTSSGTASVMVAVSVTITPASSSPYTEQESEIGQLTDTASGWKLSALGYPDGSAPTASPSPSASPSRLGKEPTMPPRKLPTTRTSRAGHHPPGIDAARVRLLADRARSTTGPVAAVIAEESPAAEPRTASGPLRRHARVLIPGALAAVTLVFGCLAAWFAASAASLTSVPAAQNSALTDNALTSQVSSQVTSAINALFSYDYATPAATKDAARRWLTGPAVAEYARLFGQVQREAPSQKLVVTTSVTSAGVELLHDGSARVLVFAIESDRRASGGTPVSAGAMLTVNAVLTDGNWQINGIDTY